MYACFIDEDVHIQITSHWQVQCESSDLQHCRGHMLPNVTDSVTGPQIALPALPKGGKGLTSGLIVYHCLSII